MPRMDDTTTGNRGCESRPGVHGRRPEPCGNPRPLADEGRPELDGRIAQREWALRGLSCEPVRLLEQA